LIPRNLEVLPLVFVETWILKMVPFTELSHIPPNGKFGKSSTQKCRLAGDMLVSRRGNSLKNGTLRKRETSTKHQFLGFHACSRGGGVLKMVNPFEKLW